jgi:MCP family monocarboxylic acid transporter-like MFS transporter 3
MQPGFELAGLANHVRLQASVDDNNAGSIHDPDASTVPANAIDAIPDGGTDAWTLVFACAVMTFFFNGWTGSWGVTQNAILQASSTHYSTSTLASVGSLSSAICVVLGLGAHRLSRVIGARYTMMSGIMLFSFGTIMTSLTVHNISALFLTAGVCIGLGMTMLYTMCNTLPVYWFSGRLGLANGLIKLGGGIGATVLAIALQAIINRIGIAWALRSLGFLALVTGVPASLMVKERPVAGRAQFADLSLFRSFPFCCLFMAGAIEVFCLFVPPFFLPLFATSIGLPASTGAAIAAAFNACTAIGRLTSGYACDRIGPINVLLIAMAINTVSTLAIWPVSSTIGPLILFSTLNGLSNGAFVVSLPTSVASIAGPGQASVGISMATTGWCAGYLAGPAIAGVLIATSNAQKLSSIEPFRAAIFYAGGVSFLSTGCVLAARMSLDMKMLKKL